jgi:alpha-mannosidase
VYSTGPAQIRKIEDGPLSATMKMDLSLLIPRDSQEEKRRSQDLVELPITHFITLTKYSRKIDVKTRFNNQARDHRLRILFPTGLQNAASSCADSHFDVVERSIELENSDHWKEPRVGTYPYRTFVDVSDGNKGLAILTQGLHEYEVLRNESRAIAITLVRSVRIKLEVSEQRKQELPDPGPQCPGLHEFRLAIYPHEGDWAQAGCPREALGLSVPLRAAQFGKNKKGSLPLTMSFLGSSNEHIEISAVKKAEAEDALIVRVYNPTKETHRGSLNFFPSIKAVYETNLNEEKKNRVKCSQNGFGMELYPKKIATYCIEIFNKRIHDDRRKEILRDIKSAQDEFSKKQCRPVSPEELMKYIN